MQQVILQNIPLYHPVGPIVTPYTVPAPPPSLPFPIPRLPICERMWDGDPQVWSAKPRHFLSRTYRHALLQESTGSDLFRVPRRFFSTAFRARGTQGGKLSTLASTGAGNHPPFHHPHTWPSRNISASSVPPPPRL
jgi:hypothetical protein